VLLIWTGTNSHSHSFYICHRTWSFNFISMAMKYKPINNQCHIRTSWLIMHVDQEGVYGNLKYSAHKTQYKHDTLLYMWTRVKLHSSDRFFKLCHTVLLLVVREPAEIILPSARRSSPSLNKFYSFISWTMKMESITSTETVVRNYHYEFRKIPKESRSQLHITPFVKFFGPLSVKYRLSLIVHNKL
jgi:hypothetical protein